MARQLEIMQILLQNGANVWYEIYDKNHISKACQLEIMEILLQNGANVNYRIACCFQTICIDDSLEQSVDAGFLPIVAIFKRDVRALLLFIQFGANPSLGFEKKNIDEKKDDGSLDILETALKFDKSALEILVQAGCPVTQTLHAKLVKFVEKCEERKTCDGSSSDDTSFIVQGLEALQVTSDQVKTLRDLVKWIEQPRPIKWMCRTLIREKMQMRLPRHIQQLPLPKALKNYVECRDLCIKDNVE